MFQKAEIPDSCSQYLDHVYNTGPTEGERIYSDSWPLWSSKTILWKNYCKVHITCRNTVFKAIIRERFL